ncbi:hypothetical protein POM88_053948 [Heracleum sosnowskyi]|uniref:Uncharacterized protein n=1 Tax=Heracleum sosnowskyi TaxID=360622 RepID=A0AAD8GNZ1_9APIA|nr:hypothetical protein POM88_053948 [Heracleum sosnowskyi]
MIPKSTSELHTFLCKTQNIRISMASGMTRAKMIRAMKDIRTKGELDFGYAAGLAGLYFCYRNGETSKLREEVAEQKKVIGGLVDEVGRCGQSQIACLNLLAFLQERL